MRQYKHSIENIICRVESHDASSDLVCNVEVSIRSGGSSISSVQRRVGKLVDEISVGIIIIDKIARSAMNCRVGDIKTSIICKSRADCFLKFVVSRREESSHRTEIGGVFEHGVANVRGIDTPIRPDCNIMRAVQID